MNGAHEIAAMRHTPAHPADAPGPDFRPRAHRIRDDGPGCSMVLVHGMEEDWEVWSRTAGLIREATQLTSLEMPWSGARGYGWTYGRETTAEWVAAGVAEAGSAPDVLVGHSYGAMALLDYLDRCPPPGLRGVVLVSPFYHPAGQTLDWGTLEHFAGKLSRFLEAAIRVRQTSRRASETVVADAAAFVRKKLGAGPCIEFMRLLGCMAGIDLNRFPWPVLIVSGEDDFMIPPKRCRDLADRLPQATLEILPGSGHFCMLDRSETLAAHIDTFLGRSRAIEKGA